MSKNGYDTMYLSVRRNGAWEKSIEGPDPVYLEKTATNWLKQGMIEAFRIEPQPWVELKPQIAVEKGAFGLPRDKTYRELCNDCH